MTEREAQLENDLVHSEAILEAMIRAVRGEPVSDFMESFGCVREAMDLRDERERLLSIMRELNDAYDDERLAGCRRRWRAWDALYEAIGLDRLNGTEPEDAPTPTPPPAGKEQK